MRAHRPLLAAAAALACALAPAGAAENTIVEYPAPTGTPKALPPSPYTDAQFAYQYFVPKAGDPNQKSLYYRLFTPPGYAGSGTLKHPLVFFLHGDGEKENGTIYNQTQMRDNGQYAFCSTADQAIFPCFYALVQTSWYGRDGGAQTAADLAVALAAKYRIDPDRVFVTGLSGGGGATLAWVSKQPATWAGCVPLSAPTPGDAGSWLPANVATVPIWLFAAADDGTIQKANQDGQVLALRQLGARPIYTLYANGGHSKATWGSAYGTRAMVQWLANLRRGQAVAQPVEVAIAAPTAATTWSTVATSTAMSGTVTDGQLGGGSSGVSGVAAVNAGGASAPATGTASWSVNSLALPAGDTWAAAVATGSSFDAARGGNTTYCDVVLVRRGTAANTAPVPRAGPDQAITLPAAANLAGSASDDGLPIGSSISYAWSQVSGPGTAVFASPASAATSVAFPAAGTWILRLTASDGALSASDDVIVAVAAAPVNAAPVVDAGADQAITLPAAASLAGSATDDGLPTGATLTYAWSQVSGPGSAVFASPSTVATGVTLPVAGTYVLRLSVSDGALSGSDTVTVTAAAAPVGGGASTILVDLGSGGTTTSGNWNNLYDNGATLAVADCVDADGARTGISATAAGFAWPSTNGVASSALYPATAQGDFLSVAAGASGTVTFAHLDPAATWDVRIFASRQWVSPATAAYTIAGTTRILEAYGNTARTADFTGVSAAGGTLTVQVQAATGSSEGDIGVIALTRHPATSRTILVDLGGAATTAGNWNNLTAPVDGAIADAIDEAGSHTGVAIAVSNAFDWSNDQGLGGGTLFPDSAAKDTFYVLAGGDGLGTVTISHLDPASAYDVELFASRQWNGASNSAYTIAGTTLQLNAYNNTAKVAAFTGLAAPDGTLAIQVRPAGAGDTGYLGVIRLTMHPVTVPAAIASARVVDHAAASTVPGGADAGGCGAGSIALVAGAAAALGLRQRRVRT